MSSSSDAVEELRLALAALRIGLERAEAQLDVLAAAQAAPAQGVQATPPHHGATSVAQAAPAQGATPVAGATPVSVAVRLPDCRRSGLDSVVKHYCVVKGAAGQPAGITRTFGTFADLVRDPARPWNGRAAIPFAMGTNHGTFPSRRDAEACYRKELRLEATAVVPYFA